MKLEKRDINVFLILWIKNDPERWGELRDIQISLLVDRIVKEKTFKRLAFEYKAKENVIRRIFDAILLKIDLCVSKEVANHLRIINIKLDERPERPFRITEIFLN